MVNEINLESQTKEKEDMNSEFKVISNFSLFIFHFKGVEIYLHRNRNPIATTAYR